MTLIDKKFTSYEKYKNFNINLRNLTNFFIKFNLENKRKCYACKNRLEFMDCVNSNKNITINNLMKIWLNKKISLYCCRCYEIMRSFPQEVITEELLLDTKKISNLEYALIQIDPDGESVFSECYGDIEGSKKLTTITLVSYVDGEDVSNFISPDDGIYIPTKINILTNIKIDDIIDKKYLKKGKKRKKIRRIIKYIILLLKNKK